MQEMKNGVLKFKVKIEKQRNIIYTLQTNFQKKKKLYKPRYLYLSGLEIAKVFI